MDTCKVALTKERRDALAKLLGLPVRALDALDIGWDEKGERWTFPECDGDGKVIGLGTRTTDGTKKTVWETTYKKTFHDPQKALRDMDKVVRDLVAKSFKDFPPKSQKKS